MRETYHYSVRVHDGVKSVSNSEHCAALELAANRFLNQSVRTNEKFFKKLVTQMKQRDVCGLSFQDLLLACAMKQKIYLRGYNKPCLSNFKP